jgi:hypothetical protein
MSFSFDINYLKCPLTGLFFNDPVLCSDGYTYERVAIDEYIKNEMHSPLTNEIITTDYHPNLLIKEIIDHIININPDYSKDKFLNKKPFNLFRQKFIGLILINKYDELVSYTNILVNSKLWEDCESETICEYLFKNCKDTEVIMKVLNNSIDYDLNDEYGRRPIHLACQHSTDIIINFLISKGVNTDCEDSDGNKPIHYVSKHQHDNDVIELFIEKHNDTFDQDGLLPIHLTCKNIKSWDSLEPFIKGNYGLDVYSKEGLTPLHYLCIYCDNPDIIKKFMNLRIDITAVTLDDNNNTCFELIYANNKLNKSAVKELIYYYLNKVYKKVNINASYLE